MKTLTLEQRVQIGDYFKDGLKAKDIAPLYGITEDQVHGVIQGLRRNGVQIPFKNIFRPTKHKTQRYSEEEKNRIISLYESGVSTKKICKEFDCSVAMLYNLMMVERKKGRIIKRKRSKKSANLLPLVEEVKEMVHGKKKEKPIDWNKAVDASMRMEKERAERERIVAENLLKVKDVTLGQWFKAKTVRILLKLLS